LKIVRLGRSSSFGRISTNTSKGSAPERTSLRAARASVIAASHTRFGNYAARDLISQAQQTGDAGLRRSLVQQAITKFGEARDVVATS
jgi:hypothetical protein